MKYSRFQKDLCFENIEEYNKRGMNNMAKEWKKVDMSTTAKIWKPVKPGDKIEGMVLSISKDQFQKARYEIMTEEGVVFAPSHSALISRLESIKKGENVKIVFTEQLPGKDGKNGTMLYDVYTA